MSFDIKIIGKLKEIIDSLNPFRAGRCLSTNMNSENFDLYELSQSLSSRAMSFDEEINKVISDVEKSQSLSSRAMSFDPKPEEPTRSLGLNPFRAGRCLSTVH